MEISGGKRLTNTSRPTIVGYSVGAKIGTPTERPHQMKRILIACFAAALLASIPTAAAEAQTTETAGQICPSYYFWDHGEKPGLRVQIPAEFSRETLIVFYERCNKAALDWAMSGENVGQIVFLYFICAPHKDAPDTPQIGSPYYEAANPSAQRTARYWSKCGTHKDYMPISGQTETRPAPTDSPADPPVTSPSFAADGGSIYDLDQTLSCAHLPGGTGVQAVIAAGESSSPANSKALCLAAIQAARSGCSRMVSPRVGNVYSLSWGVFRRSLARGTYVVGITRKVVVDSVACFPDRLKSGELYMELTLKCGNETRGVYTEKVLGPLHHRYYGIRHERIYNPSSQDDVRSHFRGLLTTDFDWGAYGCGGASAGFGRNENGRFVLP